MKRLAVIAVLSLCFAAAPHDPHPLGESQLTRLETAADDSPTVDEAAFYALLENAADWSEKEAGAVVPDYDAVRRSPQAWRGTRCLIEGTLYRVLKPELARKGWEKVDGVVVRVNQKHEPPLAEDFVIVYLTDPPTWHWWKENQGLPSESGSKVRIIGRFFKTSRYNTQSDASDKSPEQSYLAFVGRTMPLAKDAATAATPIGNFRIMFSFTLILVSIGYLVWRLRRWRRLRGGNTMRDYIAERRASRNVNRAAAEEADTADAPLELPENPADALGTLSDKHDTSND